jgi:hypothetical protein
LRRSGCSLLAFNGSLCCTFGIASFDGFLGSKCCSRSGFGSSISKQT